MARINGHEVNLEKTNAMKVYETVAGVESNGREMFNMSANRDMKSIVEDNAKEKINEKVDEYVAKLDEHEKLIQEYTENLTADLNKIEMSSNKSCKSIGSFLQMPRPLRSRRMASIS